MQRYTDSLEAMNIVLNLMIDEGDTLLVAAIAHPLDIIEARLIQSHSMIKNRHSSTVATDDGP